MTAFGKRQDKADTAGQGVRSRLVVFANAYLKREDVTRAICSASFPSGTQLKCLVHLVCNIYPCGGRMYFAVVVAIAYCQGRYSEGQAARIMAEVAEAVGYLHNKGIIHFDLKPENIMLGEKHERHVFCYSRK